MQKFKFLDINWSVKAVDLRIHIIEIVLKWQAVKHLSV
jgi:hypothetical protein